MVDLRLGITFQTERLALIREIARNLVGEARPGGTGTVGGGTAGTGTTGTIPTAGVGSVSETDVASADDTLLADRIAPREEQVATAARLAGLRLPQPMFLEPQAYRQVLAELAKSDPVLAAMAGGNPASDANAADPDAPVMPGMKMGMGAEAFSAEAAEEAAGKPVNAAPTNPGADPEAAFASSSALRREAAARAADAAATATATAATVAARATNASPLDSASLAAAADIATPAEAGTIDARTATESVVERAIASLGLAEGAAASAAMRTELGGIIASFILNAHFQPGWPPLRPVQDVEAKAFVTQLAKDPKLSKDDLAMLTYLANFGLKREQIARILKLVAAATNRSKLLQAIAQLFANIGTILGAVRDEIAELAAELQEARAGETRREHLTLR